jgi:glucuronoarabinoxylan endo-1,4-beta-xylanase
MFVEPLSLAAASPAWVPQLAMPGDTIMRTQFVSTLAIAVPVSFAACSSSNSQPPLSVGPTDVVVTWSDVKQPIDGFGASCAFFGGSITDDQADQLFDAKKGIGLSLLRIMVGVPDDTQSDGSEPTTGARPVATAPEITTAQQAVVRGCRVWAAAWTAPPIWKTTNSKYGSAPATDGDGGFSSNKLEPEHYQDFADYLADFVQLAANSSPPVPIVGLSPANEPDFTATWDDAQWTPTELTTFIGQNLAPTFAHRWPSVKIIAPEASNCPTLCDPYVTQLLADPVAGPAVSIIAAHAYTSNVPYTYDTPERAGKAFWQTEWSEENLNGDTPDPTMTSAIDMAIHIHDYIVTTGMNAWNFWAIYITEDGLTDNARLNPALIQPDQSMGDPYMFKRGYAFGNWSKFVRPGFERIGAKDSPVPGVLVEAYRDTTHLAIIAVNTNSSTVTQKFILSGATFGSVTPWVTSDADSLAAKVPIAATDTFTFDLPAKSVVTFVNWDATTETPGEPNASPLDAGGQDAAPDVKNSTGLDCSAAVVPDNGENGGVTDFTDWKGSIGKWGDLQGLYGAIYAYAGPNGSTMSANVDTTNKDLHLTGAVAAGDYGGGGLAFYDCATVALFSQVEFTISGSAPGCDLELQIKTFDQQPTSQVPAGGCDLDAGSCYNFPDATQVAVPTATAQTVMVPLSSFSNWSAANAGQVVGLQWQFTGTSVDAGSTCPIDVAITGIQFLP